MTIGYLPPAHAEEDERRLLDAIRHYSFCTLIAVVDGEPAVAQAPVLVDPSLGPKGGFRVHLARGNAVAVAGADGARITLVATGPYAYISPDWYGIDDQVPTWNYVAVYARGVARRLDTGELHAQVATVSALHEERLAPKVPWRLDKLSPGRLERLYAGLIGLAIPFDAIEGKWKLSADKPEAARAGVIAGLEARGDSASLAIAALMQGLMPRASGR